MNTFARSLPLFSIALFIVFATLSIGTARAEPLVFAPSEKDAATKHVVLIAGDEEYRSEESMPMLAKILSQKHGFRCTVLFSMSADGAFIDPNHQQGLSGLSVLDSADLLILGTRFRQLSAKEAAHLTKFLNEGKPVLGIRTATHAFRGKGSFGGKIAFGKFGRTILGEEWVSHHGTHKRQGARGHIQKEFAEHPILRGVGHVFVPSDVYGVTHLTAEDQILMRAAVTESLDPMSKDIAGPKNDPKQPFAWLHTYRAPNGTQGRAFCTTGGASVDLMNEGLRRMLVNAAYYLTDREVPPCAEVSFVDPFAPSFFGFIRTPDYWKKANLRPSDFQLGKSPTLPDPPGSPAWPFRQATAEVAAKEKLEGNQVESSAERLELPRGAKIALVGNSLAERMNLYGHFESLLHTRMPEKQLVVRNFGWPADEVGKQPRPDNYTKLDDPLNVFGPDVFFCFFGFNESFSGSDEKSVNSFVGNYRKYLDGLKKRFSIAGRRPRFVLVSPIAFEASGNSLQPSGVEENKNLSAYAKAIENLASEDGYDFANLFEATQQAFSAAPGLQYTVNGAHLNEAGDRIVGKLLDQELFGANHPTSVKGERFAKVRKWVNDKSWFHLQDYRMLNGWYVYGGRRTWDTETFPTEYHKIRNLVAVRDKYLWDLAAGRAVPEKPDDSKTGEVFKPGTMFGTRNDNFRKMREPKSLVYPTPEQSIEMMKVPEGFRVELFASEREFPELANPNQIAFDSKGRLWVSCMVNYPQWQPGAPKPTDRLLIIEDTDGDGRADKCTPFYDKLICPTGFEFWNGGVLVVDEPRILFLKDTDGDDRADQVDYLIDGIATDDTHHTVGAWEYSHGGRLHMLEGIAMSTAMETPWGPFRNKGTAGSYILDPHSMKISHFRTPGYGNPWCLVFDSWGNGIVGDGTNAQQHWTSPLSGSEVASRRTMTPVFNNEGMRPAVGSEFLLSRHFPKDVQGQFIYACVINMHGMPRFTVKDQKDSAGFEGRRIDDLLSSTDMIFRPVDPKIGPDGALWFGDWCNALIGHMQYSQRDPNRDHEHGRIYRMVYSKNDLLETVTLDDKSESELLDLLMVYELRTRYRVRRELRDREKIEVYAAMGAWLEGVSDPQKLCEAMWIQESFRDVDPALLKKIFSSDDFHARAAAIHTITNERERIPAFREYLDRAIADPHPRVRLEAIRGISFLKDKNATELALKATEKPMDYWLDYTLEHTLHALRPVWQTAQKQEGFLANSTEKARSHFETYKKINGPGGAAVRPLERAENPDLSDAERLKAVKRLVKLRGGNHQRGKPVFKRVCSACHQIGDMGTKFGPDLADVGARYNREELIKSILWPNDKIAKGFETIVVLDADGKFHNGFVLKETDEAITLGIADAKTITIPLDEIEGRKDMKASSMPEGLVKTIAPIEFLDLLKYLEGQRTPRPASKSGGAQ